MPNRFHSTLILVIVFVLGTSAGVCAMIWAWPAFQTKFFPKHRETRIEVMKRTLDLTPQQVNQVQALFKELRDKSHANSALFTPQYGKVCEEYMAVRTQERQQFAPIAQQEQAKLKSILTPEQSAKWDEQMKQFQNQQRPGPRPPDVCRAVSGSGGGTVGPPGGPQHGPGSSPGPNTGPNTGHNPFDRF